MGKSKVQQCKLPGGVSLQPGGIIFLFQAERVAVGCLLENLNEMHFKAMLAETEICSGAENRIL